jgi:diacylglycerol kinase family enzyme
LFEVILIKFPKNPVELNSILAALTIEDIDTQYIYSFKTGNMIFESDEDIPWTLDGEFGGTHKNIQLLNQKQAIDIKVKSDEKQK